MENLSDCEYWYCVIGPSSKQNRPDGADFPMRTSVQSAFNSLFGYSADTCSSGWGSVTKEIADKAIADATIYAVSAVVAKKPVLRELTIGELCKLLVKHAREYAPTALGNKNLPAMEDSDVTSQHIINETLVGFINHIAVKNGMDYGFNVDGLKTVPEPK
jgi:hypothetical protein